MPDYILEPLDTDPEDIYSEARDYIQTFYPNWEPSDAQLDALILRFQALKTAVVADMASRVQRTIYRYFGSTVLGLAPQEGVSAQLSVQFTAIDTVGYTLPSGTTIGLVDDNGDIHLFETQSDAIIAAGLTNTTVTCVAIEEGEAANGLTGTVQLVEQIDWLSSAVALAASAGGSDAETDDEYIQRLTDYLSLMAPRPLLGTDAALLARNIDGVFRACALDNFLPGTNEVQTISHNYTGNGATGGTITYSGQTTAALNFAATAAQVQAALEALNNIEVGDVACTGGPWPAAITITFKGRLEYTNVAQITASAGTWTGGTTITINTTVGGVAANFAAENAIAICCVDSSGTGITAQLKSDVDAYLQSLRQQNFIINVLDPAYTVIDVTWAGIKRPGTTKVDVDSRVNAALANYFDPANWGMPTWPVNSLGFDRVTTVRAQELYALMNNVEGLDYVTSLTFSAGAGATQDGSDKTLLGTFPMTKPGTIGGAGVT
jgi:hypothetical protein